ncbi:MAG: PTS sugar transporter subunit IIA [Coxiellaceae bacterium]|nr:PTS sugar transporter subunit IIA [Coxiellaceae bacterium]
MDIHLLLSPERVVRAHELNPTKKQLFELVSHLISHGEQRSKYKDILESLLTREKLGSTNMGHGVAIPHGRVKGLSHAIATLVLLDQPISYDESDKPVDIVLGLVVPKDADETHIEALSTLADRLSNADYRQSLRKAANNKELYEAALAPLNMDTLVTE